MSSRWSFFRPLCLLLMMCPVSGFAQQVPAWPRNAATGRVEFAGVIPWSEPALNLQQKQALVRRWYTTKLTAEKPTQFTNRAAYTTFAGMPKYAYLDSVFYSLGSSGRVDSVYDKVIWRLLYTVDLIPTPIGLSYHLTGFEGAEIVSDASNSENLETILKRYSVQQAVFYRHLRKALAGW